MAKSQHRYFCFIPKEQENDASAAGLDFVLKNRDKWVPSTEDIDSSLAPGWTRGMDHIVYQNVCYGLHKTFMFPEEDIMVYLCRYSSLGCDQIR